MMALRTRLVAETGNLMPLHAAGFHGLQAVPLVALLTGASAFDCVTRMRLTHTAGVTWLMLCAALLLQALSGAPLFAATPAAAGVAIAFLVWASCVGVAGNAFAHRRRESFVSPPGQL